MDALMLNKVGRDGRSFAAKQHSQNVDGVIIFERYQSVVNDEHRGDVNNFKVFSWFGWFYKLALLDFERIFEVKMQESEGV